MIAPAARNKKKRAFEEEEGSSGHPDYHGRALKEAQKRSSAGRPAATDGAHRRHEPRGESQVLRRIAEVYKRLGIGSTTKRTVLWESTTVATVYVPLESNCWLQSPPTNKIG